MMQNKDTPMMEVVKVVENSKCLGKQIDRNRAHAPDTERIYNARKRIKEERFDFEDGIIIKYIQESRVLVFMTF